VPSISVSSAACPGHVVVALGGDIDVVSAAWLAGSLTAVIAPGSRVIIDAAELTFIDCAALGELAAARRQALQSGGDLQLAGARRLVHRILSVVGTAGLVPAFTSVQEAVSGCHEAPGAPGSRAAGWATAADWAGTTRPSSAW
jgi:anti-anti-sigma factor